MSILLRLGLLLFVVFFIACKGDETAKPPLVESHYTVRFEMDWSRVGFPADYPSGAHFSRLIGWTHSANTDFFKVGSLASMGIKNMAEQGAIAPLNAEIETRIANGEGLQYILGSNLGAGSGVITVDVKVDTDNPSVTLATMLAPSPDWYVGIVNINLLENGVFVDKKIVEGQVYDAGTDSGPSYTSPNATTVPPEGISYFVGAPLGDGTELNASIAHVTFTRK